jgi:hypothetical protein
MSIGKYVLRIDNEVVFIKEFEHFDLTTDDISKYIESDEKEVIVSEVKNKTFKFSTIFYKKEESETFMKDFIIEQADKSLMNFQRVRRDLDHEKVEEFEDGDLEDLESYFIDATDDRQTLEEVYESYMNATDRFDVLFN